MSKLSPATRFLIASLLILVAGMTVIVVWVTREIENGVIQRTASTTAVYVDSLVAPSVQNLDSSEELPAEDREQLAWLLSETPLGQQVAVFRVWNMNGRVIYSSVPEANDIVDIDGDYIEARNGEVSAHVGSIEGEPVQDGDVPDGPLLEIYSPIRRSGTDEVVAVAEFYYGAAELEDDLASAQRTSWLIVGATTVVIYLLLAAFVQRTSNTIQRQQGALAEQVDQLQGLLDHNQELTARVQGAAQRTTALNERYLRRVSAELHDGPAQDLSVAMLQLDHIHEQSQARDVQSIRPDLDNDVLAVKEHITRALNEIRAQSAGLILPHLGTLNVNETIDHAVRSHSLRTGASVQVSGASVAEPVDLPFKIAVYRVVQEALANGWRHGGGLNQSVLVERTDGGLSVTVGDDGPGFDASSELSAERLGLLGMRERIESLGGTFAIQSSAGSGTRVIFWLPLAFEGEING